MDESETVALGKRARDPSPSTDHAMNGDTDAAQATPDVDDDDDDDVGPMPMPDTGDVAVARKKRKGMHAFC